MLSDALIAIAAVSVCCTVSAAALGVIAASDAGIKDAYEESESDYEDALSGIGECVCEEPAEEELELEFDMENEEAEWETGADTAWDTSLNSF